MIFSFSIPSSVGRALLKCRRGMSAAMVSLVAILAGCNPAPVGRMAPAVPSGESEYGGYGAVDPSMIRFLDKTPNQFDAAKGTVTPQPDLAPGGDPIPPTPIAMALPVDGMPDPTVAYTDITEVPLQTRDGKTVALKDYIQDGYLIVVFTKGYYGQICPYCSTQTARLIGNYDQIRAAGGDVVVVYPLENDEAVPNSAQFVGRVNQINQQAADKPTPFPVLLDIGLKGVDVLGIRKNLAKPATYIFGPDRKLRFAYVGSSLADRPSVAALLEQLAQLKNAALQSSPLKNEAPSQ